MRQRWMIGAAGLLAALAFAGTVDAKVNKLSGQVKGDDNSKIELGVKLNKKGKATRIVDLKYANVDLICSSGTVEEISGKLPSAKLVEERPGVFTFSSSFSDPGGPSLSVKGGLLSKTKVGGVVLGYDGATGCGTGGAGNAGQSLEFSVSK